MKALIKYASSISSFKTMADKSVRVTFEFGELDDDTMAAINHIFRNPAACNIIIAEEPLFIPIVSKLIQNEKDIAVSRGDVMALQQKALVMGAATEDDML